MNSYTAPTWTTTAGNSSVTSDASYTWIYYDTYTSYYNWAKQNYLYKPVIKYHIDSTIFKTLSPRVNAFEIP